MKNEILEIINLYFNAFINKDLKVLDEIYSDSVELIDWTGQWYGKESVLTANEELFKIDYDLFVNETKLIENITYNSITIRFDEGPIDVMDVIYFDENKKISKVRAFKG